MQVDVVGGQAADGPAGPLPDQLLPKIFRRVEVELRAVELDDETLGGPAEVGLLARAALVDGGFGDPGFVKDLQRFRFGVAARAVDREAGVAGDGRIQAAGPAAAAVVMGMPWWVVASTLVLRQTSRSPWRLGPPLPGRVMTSNCALKEWKRYAAPALAWLNTLPGAVSVAAIQRVRRSSESGATT
jgi:hypothetical protein